MKVKTTILACLISMVGLAQSEIPTNEETGKAEYKQAEAVPGLTPEQLYDRAIAWVNKFYVNPNGVLQTQDKEGATIVGRARFKLSRTEKKGHVNPNAGYVAYQITFQFKDGKYRYIIDAIRWEQNSYYDVTKWSDTEQTGYDAEEFNSYIEQTTKYFDDLTENLVGYMKVGEVKKSDDW